MNIFQVLLIQPLANGLALFYRLFGDLGLAIIGFSLFLRFILTPLTRPYMESMKKMKEYAPQLEKIKKRHEGNKQKQMEAQAQFYKEKNIKPGAGCLPYILQIVVLIAFFQVFNRILIGEGNIVEKFNALLYAPFDFVQDTQISTDFLYLDLTKPDVINVDFLPFGIPGIFIVGAAIVQLATVKLTSGKAKRDTAAARGTKDTADDMQVAIQNSMIYTMPLLTVYAGYRFPSGLAVYWFVVSLYNLIQQYLAYKNGSSFINRAGLLQLASPNDKGKNNKR